MFLKSGLPQRKPQVLVFQQGVDLNRGAVISGKAVLREAGSPLRGALATEAVKMKRAASFLPRDHDDHHHFGGGGDGDRHHGGDGHHDGGHHNHKDNSDDGGDSGDDESDGDDDSGSDGSDDEDSDGSDDEDSDEDSGSDDDDDDGDDDDNDDGDGGSDDNVGGDADGGGQVGNNISGVAPGNPAATTTPSQLPTVNNGGDGGQSSLPSSTPPPPNTSTSTSPPTTAAPTIDPTPTSSIAVVMSPQSPGSTTEKTSTPSDNSPAGSALPDNTDNSGVLPSPTAVASKSSATSSLPGTSSTSSVSAGPTTLASTSAKQPSANIGAIVGSVLGILVLLVVVVLLLIRRRLRRKQWLLFASDRQNPFETDGERNMVDFTSTPREAGIPHLTLPEPVSPHRSWFSSLARLPQPPEQSRFSDPTETDVESTRSTTLSFLRPTDVDRDSNPSVPPYPSSSSPTTRLSAGSTIASSASRWSFVDPFRGPPEKGQPRGSISSYPSQTLYLSGADDNRYTHLRQTDTVT